MILITIFLAHVHGIVIKYNIESFSKIIVRNTSFQFYKGEHGYEFWTAPQYGNPAGAPGYAPGTDPQYSDGFMGTTGMHAGASEEFFFQSMIADVSGNAIAPGYAPGTDNGHTWSDGFMGYAPGKAP